MKRASGRLFLSATDLSNHLACKHLTALDVDAAQGNSTRPHRTDHRLKRLQELGDAHEQAYLQHLREQGMSVAAFEADDFTTDASQRAINAMRTGVDVIYQPWLVDANFRGRADFLIRVDAPSDLGDWSYIVQDTKLTSNTRGGTILQLCLYSDIVGKLQGRTPDIMHVVAPSTNYTTEEYAFREYAAYYRHVRQRLVDATRTESAAQSDPRGTTYPHPVPHCDICNWWETCRQRRKDDDHLSRVAGCTRLHTNTLEESGIGTLAELATSDPPSRPRRGAPATYVNLHHQARVQHKQNKSGSPVWELRDFAPGSGLHLLPPPSPGDIFFDIEGDRFASPPNAGAATNIPGLGDGFEYLFGYAVGTPSEGYTYTARWALASGAAGAAGAGRDAAKVGLTERQMFEEFIDWVTARRAQYPDLHIYHYNHYEVTALKRLMSHYATRGDEVDALLRGHVFVDLYTVVRQAIRAGVESYSIKQLEQYYGFKRSVDLKEEANPHLRLLEAALELGGSAIEQLGEETLQAVEGYNRDDVLSTAALRDWLEQARTDAIADGAEIARPEPQSDEASTKTREKLDEIRAVSSRLLAWLPDDGQTANLQTWQPDQKAVWLLANLLEWHLREDKVAAWEYFRLAGLPEDELYDERSAIAGLAFVERVDEAKRLDAYDYPKQEVKLKPRADLKTIEGTVIGKIDTINPLERRLVIQKRKAQADTHPTAVFDAGFWVTDPRPAALLRFGTFVADALAGNDDWMSKAGSDDAPSDKSSDAAYTWLSATRLLMRHAPVDLLKGSATLSTPLDRALYIASRLDGDYLAIQGPPGSGKTYTGARIICELVSQGKKVGVTANSHKVIRNLLDEFVAVSDELGIADTVNCLQKVRTVAAKEDQHPRIAEVTSNENVRRAIDLVDESDKGDAGDDASPLVFGGTGFMWGRPEFADTVDVLIVDEAAQLSLANVLAVAQAGRSLILLGDPAQLDQPQKAAHPEGTNHSALDHVLMDDAGKRAELMPDNAGLFIDQTRRLHPDICAFTSEAFYSGKLKPLAGLEQQRINNHPIITSSGLYYLPVEHTGNRNESEEEARAIESLVASLVAPPTNGGATVTWTNAEGEEEPVTLEDILIVAPYNAHVTLLQAVLAQGASQNARVGTVDKFQGQEAPIVIYSLATSHPTDAPRGMEFLYDLNRLNVATSRARCAVVVVGSPALLEPECRTPQQMKLANALVRYREVAQVIGV